MQHTLFSSKTELRTITVNKYVQCTVHLAQYVDLQTQVIQLDFFNHEHSVLLKKLFRKKTLKEKITIKKYTGCMESL